MASQVPPPSSVIFRPRKKVASYSRSSLTSPAVRLPGLRFLVATTSWKTLLPGCLAIYANMRQSNSNGQFDMPWWAVPFVSWALKHGRMTTLLFRGCGMHSRLRALSEWISKWNRLRPPAPMRLRLTTTS